MPLTIFEPDNATRQAPLSVVYYVDELRKSLPDGFAEKHPDAFARMVQACALDNLGAMVRELADAVRSMDGEN